MVGEQFRLTRPIRGSQGQGENLRAITIPEDTVLTVEGLHDNGRIARVQYNNMQALLFTEDLRANSTQLSSSR
jgi:hypothetical protein